MKSYIELVAPKEKLDSVRKKAGRTIDEILGKESEFDIYALLGAIEVLVGTKICRGLETSSAERMVFALTWLGREVQNGGFHQYFFNSAGDFWDDALVGLKLIKDEDGLRHFQQTLSVFENSSPSKERYVRQEELEKLEADDEDRVWDHFGEMTKMFYTKPFPNWHLVYAYIKDHADEFIFENI